MTDLNSQKFMKWENRCIAIQVMVEVIDKHSNKFGESYTLHSEMGGKFEFFEKCRKFEIFKDCGKFKANDGKRTNGSQSSDDIETKEKEEKNNLKEDTITTKKLKYGRKGRKIKGLNNK